MKNDLAAAKQRLRNGGTARFPRIVDAKDMRAAHMEGRINVWLRLTWVEPTA
jgi:hypothetical protein